MEAGKTTKLNKPTKHRTKADSIKYQIPIFVCCDHFFHLNLVKNKSWKETNSSISVVHCISFCLIWSNVVQVENPREYYHECHRRSGGLGSWWVLKWRAFEITMRWAKFWLNLGLCWGQFQNICFLSHGYTYMIDVTFLVYEHMISGYSDQFFHDRCCTQR